MTFTNRSLTFLRGLRRNNNRNWFEEHREQYEADVRAPMRELIEVMDVRLAQLAPEIIGSAKKSMFRINRDIRFSPDKSPYKTHAACWFYHRDGDRKVGSQAEGGGAGFYFHLEPGQSFVGGGIWMPPRPVLNRIREALAANHTAFERIVRAPALVRRFGGLDDESMLKRMPRGYAEDHPAAAWLRHQSFTVGHLLTDNQVTSSRLPSLLEADFEAMRPLVRWLNKCLGFPESRAR
jgi:uncharacterized protein (TIGR02453 family)